MTQKPNFREISRKELRAYVLANRSDEEAIHLYVDRMHTDPDVFRVRGSYGEEGDRQFKELIEQHITKRQASS
jgi:hypothetical protein